MCLWPIPTYSNICSEFFPYLDFLRTKYVSFDHYHDDMGDIEDVGSLKLASRACYKCQADKQ
jgi:hypothetical protein